MKIQYLAEPDGTPYDTEKEARLHEKLSPGLIKHLAGMSYNRRGAYKQVLFDLYANGYVVDKKQFVVAKFNGKDTQAGLPESLIGFRLMNSDEFVRAGDLCCYKEKPMYWIAGFAGVKVSSMLTNHDCLCYRAV